MVLAPCIAGILKETQYEKNSAQLLHENHENQLIFGPVWLIIPPKGGPSSNYFCVPPFYGTSDTILRKKEWQCIFN